MDSATEKLCLDEIDHVVLDNDKKVTLAYVSNNWSIPNKDSEIILEKWLKKYTGDKRIAKEYLIRGTDANGNSVISIVPEKSLPKVDKICPNHTRILYSIEVGSENGRSLNIQEPTPNKFISLKLKSEKRSFKSTNANTNGTAKPVDKSIKKEVDPPKKSTNIFGTTSSKPAKPNKDVANTSKDVKVKEEKTSPNRTQSPKKQSPKKNQAPAKTNKAPTGKSIANFFSSKPTTSTAVKADKSVSEATSKIQNVTIKDEPVEVASNESKNSQKRPHSNASDSNEDSKPVESKQSMPSKKKIKLELKSARSRLMQICDSSSDEEDASTAKDLPMDVEEKPVVTKEKENKTPSPEKSDKNKTNGSTDSKKRRSKVKKMVSRTYEDEEGFINTVREMEEVSCSEEESEVVVPPPKKVTPVSSNSTSTAGKKKISPPVGGKKQGSILSFFGKK